MPVRPVDRRGERHRPHEAPGISHRDRLVSSENAIREGARQSRGGTDGIGVHEHQRPEPLPIERMTPIGCHDRRGGTRSVAVDDPDTRRENHLEGVVTMGLGRPDDTAVHQPPGAEEQPPRPAPLPGLTGHGTSIEDPGSPRHDAPLDCLPRTDGRGSSSARVGTQHRDVTRRQRHRRLWPGRRSFMGARSELAWDVRTGPLIGSTSVTLASTSKPPERAPCSAADAQRCRGHGWTAGPGMLRTSSTADDAGDAGCDIARD
jgi:hypothetical protein